MDEFRNLVQRAVATSQSAGAYAAGDLAGTLMALLFMPDNLAVLEKSVDALQAYGPRRDEHERALAALVDAIQAKLNQLGAAHGLPLAVGPPFAGFIEFGRYASGEIGMTIYPTRSFEGAPIVKATVSLALPPAYAALDPDECWIKTWSENHGVLEALIAAGVCHDTERRHGLDNNCEAALVRLSGAALRELQRQEAGR